MSAADVTLHLDERAAVQAYLALRGRPSELGAILGRTRSARAAGSRVRWCVTAQPHTVHSLESLYRLALDEQAELALSLAPESMTALSERQHAFFEDFARHCLGLELDRASPLLMRLKLGLELLEELGYLLAALPRLTQPIAKSLPDELAHVTIIGAYGGDHVGDAAILGGVVLGLHARYGVSTATVMSHRPAHTRRLIAGLDTPVQLSVCHYDPRSALRSMKQAGALVVAGGPMMDLPRVLAKHLVAAGAAALQGAPLLIDRVGIGPYRRRTSRWASRALLRRAVQVSTRSSRAALDPLLQGLNVTVGRDPAFDYLATRKTLTRLDADDAQRVDALLEGTQGRLVVGINLRPIRHDWSPRGEAYSRSVDESFYSELAAAMTSFADGSSQPVTFVFFPMNPIQFGMSDLEAAYRLCKQLPPRIDYRVWEADPDVDAVLYMIRRFACTVAMRFHACIFALSQSDHVIGIDYYPGQNGKVKQLFDDLGRDGDARVLSEVTGAWLRGRLESHTTSAASPRVQG
ncbi:MAG: hypothetical protein JWN48_1369 [Myxococcaceae bacterium]|nr:hypothetical protein [Myxococcaceae bacterium]